MKKLITILTILLLLPGVCHSANDWRGGDGEEVLLGSSNVSDLDVNVFQKVVDPLDTLLNNYRMGTVIKYASTSTVTVNAGEVACQNTAGTIVKFRQNTSALTLTWSDIDTGSESGSTTYYVYAVCDADATTFTGTISTNSSTPSGKTYFARLGQFTNNGSSNIESVQDDNVRAIISSGTVGNGSTISLPSGWVADECSWTVGLGTVDPSTANARGLDSLVFTVNSSRSVTATWGTYNWVDGGASYSGTGTANYIIGCVR